MARTSGCARAALATAGALVVLAGEAGAGGFALKERSTKAQGLSFAGATAGSGGLSSMGFNPAALGTIEAGGEVSGGLSLVSPIADGEVFVGGVPTGQSVDADRLAGVANAYGGYHIDGYDVTLGLGVYTPFGLATGYEPDFIGRADGLTSTLLTLSFSPTVAWQPIPELTLGAALNVLYADARLTRGTTLPVFGLNLDGDDTAVSFGVGALWEVTPGTTVGVAYQHGYDLELVGEAESAVIPGVFDVTATAELPATVSVGVTQEITDRVRLMGEFQWQNWSVFDQIDIEIPAFGPAGSVFDPQDYEDAFFVAVGGEYDVTGALTLRAGAAWDETPTQDADLAAGLFGRTVRVPDEDRIWLSVGGSYDIGQAITLDAGYSFLFALDDPEVALRTVPGGTVAYDGGAHIFSVGGSLRF
jgi:long-chain fatty acid transport protein